MCRLGLYIFGRQSLFANCYEMQPTFKHLLARPTQLALQPLEYWQVGVLIILESSTSRGVPCEGVLLESWQSLERTCRNLLPKS